MGIESVLASIDAEIEKLQQVRNMLAGGGGSKGSAKVKPKHHTMTEEGKRRIAEAQKRRWAKVRAAEKK